MKEVVHRQIQTLLCYFTLKSDFRNTEGAPEADAAANLTTARKR